jgi:hypothetical protein
MLFLAKNLIMGVPNFLYKYSPNDGPVPTNAEYNDLLGADKETTKFLAELKKECNPATAEGSKEITVRKGMVLSNILAELLYEKQFSGLASTERKGVIEGLERASKTIDVDMTRIGEVYSLVEQSGIQYLKVVQRGKEKLIQLHTSPDQSIEDGRDWVDLPDKPAPSPDNVDTMTSADKREAEALINYYGEVPVNGVNGFENRLFSHNNEGVVYVYFKEGGEIKYEELPAAGTATVGGNPYEYFKVSRPGKVAFLPVDFSKDQAVVSTWVSVLPSTIETDNDKLRTAIKGLEFGFEIDDFGAFDMTDEAATKTKFESKLKTSDYFKVQEEINDLPAGLNKTKLQGELDAKRVADLDAKVKTGEFSVLGRGSSSFKYWASEFESGLATDPSPDFAKFNNFAAGSMKLKCIIESMKTVAPFDKIVGLSKYETDRVAQVSATNIKLLSELKTLKVQLIDEDTTLISGKKVPFGFNEFSKTEKILTDFDPNGYVYTDVKFGEIKNLKEKNEDAESEISDVLKASVQNIIGTKTRKKIKTGPFGVWSTIKNKLEKFFDDKGVAVDVQNTALIANSYTEKVDMECKNIDIDFAYDQTTKTKTVIINSVEIKQR